MIMYIAYSKESIKQLARTSEFINKVAEYKVYTRGKRL